MVRLKLPVLPYPILLLIVLIGVDGQTHAAGEVGTGPGLHGSSGGQAAHHLWSHTAPGYERTSPSYQRTPPSYQQTPPSYQRTPPSNQRTPPSNQWTVVSRCFVINSFLI